MEMLIDIMSFTKTTIADLAKLAQLVSLKFCQRKMHALTVIEPRSPILITNIWFVLANPWSEGWVKWLKKDSPSEFKALTEKFPLEFEKKGMKHEASPQRLDVPQIEAIVKQQVIRDVGEDFQSFWLSVQLKDMEPICSSCTV